MNQDALNALIVGDLKAIAHVVAAEALKQVDEKIDSLNQLDKDMLPDAVHECVQNLRSTVEVETR